MAADEYLEILFLGKKPNSTSSSSVVTSSKPPKSMVKGIPIDVRCPECCNMAAV